MLLIRLFALGSLALILLSASDTQLSPTDTNNYQQIQKRDFVRAKHGQVSGRDRIVKRAVEHQDSYWLEQAAQLGDASALYKLSQLSKNDKERLKWLKKAADLNVAEAQFELSLLPSQKQHRLALLRSSADQEYQPAQHALANWLLLNQQESAAIEWLMQSAENYPQDAFSLANIRWREKEFELARYWFEIAANQGHEQSKRYLNVVDKEASIGLDESNQRHIKFDSTQRITGEDCAKHVLPLSLSLANHVQAKSIVKAFNADNRFNNIPICLANPIWLRNDESLCNQQTIANRSRTVCNVHRFEDLIKNNNITHIIIFLPEGRAYVNAGVMYLNSLASYSLFVHELAHFAGFADEYPINDALAAVHCNAKTAPNLIFDGELTYAPQTRLSHWQSFYQQNDASAEISIHRARTCNSVGKTAYKLTDKRTFMEFHDTEYIPPEYLHIWRQQVIGKAHWYPVSINIARYYESVEFPELAQFWRKFAEQQRNLDSAQKDKGI